jgi:hypothetical protein
LKGEKEKKAKTFFPLVGKLHGVRLTALVEQMKNVAN